MLLSLYSIIVKDFNLSVEGNYFCSCSFVERRWHWTMPRPI